MPQLLDRQSSEKGVPACKWQEAGVAKSLQMS